MSENKTPLEEEIAEASKEVYGGWGRGVRDRFRDTAFVLLVSFFPLFGFFFWPMDWGLVESLLGAAGVGGLVFPVLGRTRLWWIVLLFEFSFVFMFCGMTQHWPPAETVFEFLNDARETIREVYYGVRGVPTPTVPVIGPGAPPR